MVFVMRGAYGGAGCGAVFCRLATLKSTELGLGPNSKGFWRWPWVKQKNSKKHR